MLHAESKLHLHSTKCLGSRKRGIRASIEACERRLAALAGRGHATHLHITSGGLLASQPHDFRNMLLRFPSGLRNLTKLVLIARIEQA